MKSRRVVSSRAAPAGAPAQTAEAQPAKAKKKRAAAGRDPKGDVSLVGDASSAGDVSLVGDVAAGREASSDRDASYDRDAGQLPATGKKRSGASAATRSTRARGAAASTSALGARAAMESLAQHGSAVDAVLAGFFAEAGNDASVLLGPVSALVFGAGAGVRAFDGRARQAGLGAPRPRGAKDGDRVTEAAAVAAPRSIPTAILLHTMYGRIGLASATRQGAADAKTVGADARSRWLTQIGRAGGAALSRSSVVDALLAVGGRSAGGALSEADLAEALPADVALAPSATIEAARIYRAPWGSQVGAASSAIRGVTESLVACDAWGLVALLSFERAPGLMVPELEVMLPLSGVPVRRGVPRTSPGTVLPAPAPLVVIDRGADLRVAFGARVDAECAHRVLTPVDVAPIATATPVDGGVRAVARALGVSAAAVALEARGARGIATTDLGD